MLLNEDAHFLNSQSVKTYKGAEGRLERLSKVVKYSAWQQMVKFIIQKPDGTYMPVLIITEKNSWITSHACNMGVYCRSA